MNENLFEKTLSNVRKCMINAGDEEFAGIAIRDADLSCILPTDESLHEHWQHLQASVAYYGHMLNQARTALDEAEEDLKIAVYKERGTLHELAKTKFQLSRPSKEDIVVIAIIEGKENISKLHDNVKYLKGAVRDLETWLEVWDKKSFVLNGMSDSVAAQAHAPSGVPAKHVARSAAI